MESGHKLLTRTAFPNDHARMGYDAGASTKTFLLSVAVGSFSGVALGLVLASLAYPAQAAQELWAIPLLVLVYGGLAFPFVTIGLAIFGLPMTALLREHWDKPWAGIVALLWGAVAGKMMWLAVDSLLFLGVYKITNISADDPGVLYGVPTAIAWWLLRRKEIAAAA